jgi:hypothetical protein
MVAFIASLLGFGGMAGLTAQIGSTNGPSACPLCCRGRAAAQGTDLASGRRRWIAERQGEGARHHALDSRPEAKEIDHEEICAP